MDKCQISAHIVHLVTLREHLCAELTADVSVCGQLSNQHSLVSSAQTIHRNRWNDVPATANAIVDGEALTSLKGIGP